MVSVGWLQKHCTSKLHADIKFDIDHGYLKVIDPRLTPEIVAELDDGADDTGIYYPEWLKAKLVLLPKKGDLGQPKNWRGICLLDIASKILSCVMVERLKEVMEENGPENQCGFRPERGTIDGTFNLLMALRKRQEHNLETYVSFVDLVKAFDSVPRAALFKVLRRYGLPDHFINLVIRLHADAVVNFKLGNEEVEVKNRKTCETRKMRMTLFISVHHGGGNGDYEVAGGETDFPYLYGQSPSSRGALRSKARGDFVRVLCVSLR